MIFTNLVQGTDKWELCQKTKENLHLAGVPIKTNRTLSKNKLEYSLSQCDYKNKQNFVIL